MTRVYFLLCLTFGRMLRAGRYSKVRIVTHEGEHRVREHRVRKHRTLYAPLLVRLGDPLARLLDTGVRVVPQREWEQRERTMYRSLYDMSIRIDGDGVLVLPRLTGRTLAELLENSQLRESHRTRAIHLAVNALASLHHAGFTHGDAMADNVMVDLDAGVARWFDFETVHDPHRRPVWCRADDVRALLATCLLRTDDEQLVGTLDLILDTYADEEVARLLATTLSTVVQRPLMFHLGQAGLSFRCYRKIGRVLSERLSDPPGSSVTRRRRA